MGAHRPLGQLGGEHLALPLLLARAAHEDEQVARQRQQLRPVARARLAVEQLQRRVPLLSRELELHLPHLVRVGVRVRARVRVRVRVTVPSPNPNLDVWAEG